MSKKPIDIHTHLLNYQITPEKIYFGREWDLKKWSPILHAYCDSDPIDDALEWVYNLFAEKDIDSDPLAKVFFTPLSEQWKLFAEMPVTPNVMTIDFRDNSGTQLQHDKAYQAACDCTTIDWGGLLTLGQSPYRYIPKCMHHVHAIKMYPSLWNENIELEYELACNASQTTGKPIIAHASQGGIGRNKANNRPLRWWDALMEYPESVICFAHAIGYDDEEWEVIERMALEFRFPNGDPRIYVDTAFVDGFKYNTDLYYNRLVERLGGNCADGIMFGSDWPLHLPFYSTEELLESHREHLSPWLWELISRVNPERFLGIK